MHTFIITFGRDGLRNGWVRVTAYSEDIVRAWANREYDRVWSMVYSGEEWEQMPDRERYYPAGEIGFIPLFYQEAADV